MIPIILILLDSCKKQDTPYVKPIIVDNIGLLSNQQKETILSGDKFSGFYIELIDSVHNVTLTKYAKYIYRKLYKQRKGKDKEMTFVIIYDRSNRDFVYKTSNITISHIEYEGYGNLYRVLKDAGIQPYKSIVGLSNIRSLAFYNRQNRNGIKGIVETTTIMNPLLNLFNLTSKFVQPSKNIIHYFFFYVPLNLTMIIIHLTHSIQNTILIIMILYIICCMGFGSLIGNKKSGRRIYVWLAYLIMYGLMLICAVSIYNPDIEMANALANSGYHMVFEEYISSYYDSFNDNYSHSIILNILFIIVLIIYCGINILVKSDDEADDNDMGNIMITGIIVSLVTGSFILLLIIGYMFANIFINVCKLKWVSFNNRQANFFNYIGIPVWFFNFILACCTEYMRDCKSILFTIILGIFMMLPLGLYDLKDN